MCEMALKKGIRDKTIVNFRDSDAYIGGTQRGIRMLNILKARNNVRYILQDTEEIEVIAKLLLLNHDTRKGFDCNKQHTRLGGLGGFIEQWTPFRCAIFFHQGR
jgi:hypothetical protein